jgi:hypothetical protein
MTTAQQFRSVVSRPRAEIEIAGVPWPAYKLLALVLGLAVLAIVAVTTASAAPAVLGGAATATVAWLGLSVFHREG